MTGKKREKPYLPIKFNNSSFAGLNQYLLPISWVQDVVRGDTRLAGVDALPPHNSTSSHLKVGIRSH